MLRVKGIYHDKTITLLEPLALPTNTAVEVIIAEPAAAPEQLYRQRLLTLGLIKERPDVPADTTPYKAIPNNIPLDQMNPAVRGLNGREKWAAEQSLAMNWKDPDDIPSDVLNKILWWSTKGYDKEYPVLVGRK